MVRAAGYFRFRGFAVFRSFDAREPDAADRVALAAFFGAARVVFRPDADVARVFAAGRFVVRRVDAGFFAAALAGRLAAGRFEARFAAAGFDVCFVAARLAAGLGCARCLVPACGCGVSGSEVSDSAACGPPPDHGGVEPNAERSNRWRLRSSARFCLCRSCRMSSPWRSRPATL